MILSVLMPINLIVFFSQNSKSTLQIPEIKQWHAGRSQRGAVLSVCTKQCSWQFFDIWICYRP